MESVTIPTALIFDMDGVLVSTLELHYSAWQKVAEAGQVTFNSHHMDRFRGWHRLDCLRELFEQRALSPAEIAHYFAIKDREFERLLAKMGARDILPGVLPMLQEAQALGLKLGVASSSTYAWPVLRQTGLFKYFDVVADGHTVSRSKPAPDIFVWVAGALGVRLTEVIVFEDSQAGVEAACKIGVFTVGIGAPALVQGADIVVSSLTETSLHDTLNAFSRSRAQDHPKSG